MKTPLTYFAYWTYQGRSSPYFASRFSWIDSGTARSEVRNGFPSICRMSTKVRKMTSRITGIVHRIRRMMNPVI